MKVKTKAEEAENEDDEVEDDESSRTGNQILLPTKPTLAYASGTCSVQVFSRDLVLHFRSQ